MSKKLKKLLKARISGASEKEVKALVKVLGIDPYQGKYRAQKPIRLVKLGEIAEQVVKRMKIRTLGDLAKKTEEQLLANPGFGRSALKRVKNVLEQHGLKLAKKAEPKAKKAKEEKGNRAKAVPAKAKKTAKAKKAKEDTRG